MRQRLSWINQLTPNLHTGDTYVWMSMQQLGGGPPGDEDYFNLEDEETQEASSGERNPNVSAWDPEKMELLRIVDRLLEERRNLPPSPAEQPVLHKVKLPPFRGKKMATWLGLTEAVLEDNSLRDPRVMYKTMLLQKSTTTCWRGPGGSRVGQAHVAKPVGLCSGLIVREREWEEIAGL